MPTFTAIASDTFTGSDENPLSHDSSGNVAWTTGTGVGAFQRFSNLAKPANGAVDTGSYWSLNAFNANQYSRGNLTIGATGTGGGGRGSGLLVRQASAANTCFRFVVDRAATNNAEIAKIVAGVYTLLGARWTQTFTDGDQFTFAVETSGADAVLYVYDKNGAQVATRTDTSTSITSGSAGIAYSSNEGTPQVDNWEGGTFSTLNSPPMFRGS